MEGYYPLVSNAGKEIANIRVKMSYIEEKEEKEIEPTQLNISSSQEKVKRKPLLKSRRITRNRPIQPTQSVGKVKSVEKQMLEPGRTPEPPVRPGRVTFSAGLKSPISDSLVESLLDRSTNLRHTMREPFHTSTGLARSLAPTPPRSPARRRTPACGSATSQGRPPEHRC